MTQLMIPNYNDEPGISGEFDGRSPAPAATQGSCTVLAYHELSSGAPSYLYSHGCDGFDRHLQLAVRLRSNPLPGTPQLRITFDDGHISNYRLALPLLEKYSCKATFFVIAGMIGTQNFMTWDHLREIVALGHRVESHSFSHVFLTRLGEAELRSELLRSKATLEDRLGHPVTALSAPHGKWNRNVARMCAETGYLQLFTSNPWQRRREAGVELIGRFMVRRSTGSDGLYRWLTMGPAETCLRRAQYGFKHSVQFVLGNRLYHKLWTRFSGWRETDGPC